MYPSSPSRMSRVCVLQFDAEMEARSSEAAESGRKLVYVGLVDVAAGTCSVALQVQPVLSPLSMRNQAERHRDKGFKKRHSPLLTVWCRPTQQVMPLHS